MDRGIAVELRRRGVDVTTTPGAGLLGLDDEDHIAFALSQRRVIVTDDADFLRHAAAGSKHAGVAFARRGARTIGQIVEGLLTIHGAMTPDDMAGHVEYL